MLLEIYLVHKIGQPTLNLVPPGQLERFWADDEQWPVTDVDRADGQGLDRLAHAHFVAK